ncbi:unnamed protein product [marine sediment metagenome]|uniref:Uncharacterized protein n=1 Tax=marine sediment metagenome TaxID=412755 RepID=X1QS03_9ZZZZ
MFHKIIVGIVRRFLKKTQAWVDKTPGAISVSMDIGDRTIVLAEKKHENARQVRQEIFSGTGDKNRPQ